MIKSITYGDYLLFKDVTLSFTKGIIQVTGINKDASDTKLRTNASGKSLLLAGLSNTLFDQNPLIDKKSSKVDKTSVRSVILRCGGSEYTISRSGTRCVIMKDGIDQEIPTTGKCNDYIENLIGINYLTYNRLTHIDLLKPVPLLWGTASERKQFFSDLHDLSYLDEVRKDVSAMIADVGDIENNILEYRNLLIEIEDVELPPKVSKRAYRKVYDKVHDTVARRKAYVSYSNNKKYIDAALKEKGLPSKVAKLREQAINLREVESYLEIQDTLRDFKIDDPEKVIKSYKKYVDNLEKLEDYNEYKKNKKAVDKWQKKVKEKFKGKSLDKIIGKSEDKVESAKKALKSGASGSKCEVCLSPVKDWSNVKAHHEKVIKDNNKIIASAEKLQDSEPRKLPKVGKVWKVSEVSKKDRDQAKKCVSLQERLDTFDIPKENFKIKSNVGDELSRLEKLLPFVGMEKAVKVSSSKVEKVSLALTALDIARNAYSTAKTTQSLNQKLRSKYNKRITSLTKEATSADSLKILSEVFAKKGLMTYIVDKQASAYVAMLNVLSPQLSVVETKYSYTISPTEFYIHATRGGRTSDVRTLSASERAIFLLTSIVAIKTILGDKIPNFLILDEVNANMDTVGVRLFVDKFLPMLETLYETVIVVTPVDLGLSGVRNVVVVRENDVSTLSDNV